MVKDKLKTKLENGKDSAYLSKKLAAIWTDAPVDLELEKLDVGNCDPNEVREVLQKLEFRTLVRQLPEVMQVAEEHMHHIESKLVLPKNIIIESNDKIKNVDLSSADHLIVHSYCAGKHGKKPKVILISPSASVVYSLDLDKLDQSRVRELLEPFLSKEAIPKIGYDIKSTIQVAYELGCNFSGVGHDVLVGAFLLNALRREQTLTELASADLGYEGSEFENLAPEELIDRAPEIIAVIRGLHDGQSEELKSLTQLTELAQTVEWPVVQVLAAMEYEGIGLDTGYLKKMSVELTDQISDIEQQIYGYADQEFNVGSPSQLADILFEKLMLPATGIKKGKTGYSTAAKELDKLRGQHPIIDLITQFRESTKLKNTYVDTLPTMVDENSRLHTTFSLTIAQTGRLSSNDPNLQNIPVRTELGNRIRTAFVAGKGKVFVSADYSQFELRLAAYLANDEELN